MAKGENDKFPTVENCVSTGRETQTVVADMDGTLLRGRSSFPYFAILAFELGGIVRMSFLLLAAPLAGLLYYLVSETAGIQVLIFTTFVGAKVSDIESVARAVLPKFYSEDLHPEAWRVFSSCGKRCVLTANPRIMVEAFLRDYLGVDMVIGTEISSLGGRATGFVKSPGVLVGSKKADALEEAMREWEWECVAHVGLGDRRTDFPFMKLCKEGYMVPAMPKVEAVNRDKLPKPIVFHDGRLVHRPTPILTLITIMWFPVGFLLACLRIAAGALLPMSMVYHAFLALGVHVRINGIPPPATKRSGVLFICSHRTLLDPIFLSTAIGRPVSAVTYSVSRVSEWLSPIKTVPLTRERAKDAAMIKSLLEEGDLVICPEGTTCREPFLLRFSALFAELTDQIVPVAMRNEMSMFHGTTARGWKGMDAFYFFMNPTPLYEVTFLNKLPMELTCSGGKTSHEVANYIQRVLAATLSYECTNFTRRDKYKALAGNDGTLAQNKAGAALFPNKLMGC